MRTPSFASLSLLAAASVACAGAVRGPARADPCAGLAPVALREVGAAAPIAAAIRSASFEAAEAATVGALTAARDEAVTLFQGAPPEVETLRAFFDTWVFAEQPLLAVGPDAFALHPDLRAALAALACREGRPDAQVRWSDPTWSPVDP